MSTDIPGMWAQHLPAPKASGEDSNHHFYQLFLRGFSNILFYLMDLLLFFQMAPRIYFCIKTVARRLYCEQPDSQPKGRSIDE